MIRFDNGNNYIYKGMFIHYFTTCLLVVILLTSCNESNNYKLTGENETAINRENEVIDDNFNDFIKKFSSDSIFQLSRISFPLKTKMYDIDNERDTIIFLEKHGFELMDFRKKKSEGKYDQWEQKIVVDKSNTSAKIEIRGIDNGIMVDYLFEKDKDGWMLVGIEDNST